MKSIMEEASSISKAIDQAWARAGKPYEFSIKILETPARNLFGLTVKSAKIALFFDEQKIVAKLSKPIEKPLPIPKQEQSPVPQQSIAPQKPKEVSSVTPLQQPSQWTPEMIQFTQDWIQNIFQTMGLGQVAFTTSTSVNGLTFRFKTSITGNEFKDRLLFSSFAYLILTMLRQKYKRAFKNLKVILFTE